MKTQQRQVAVSDTKGESNVTSPLHAGETTFSFGYWVRRRRQALGLTQAELAVQVACSEVTIRKIEADERRPSRPMAERLAACLAVPAEEQDRFLAAALGEQSAAHLRLDGRPLLSAAQRSLLPTPLPTPLPGREVETSQVVDLLLCGRRDAARLVTLTGPGGVGKTRLAQQVSDNLRAQVDDEIYFVDLAPLTAPHLVIDAIAQTLGVREGDSRPVHLRVREYLAGRQILLVLDNFEQLLPAAPALTELLAAAPGLRLLVTSRERLRVQGERLYPLAPLPLPPMEQTFTAKELLEHFACVQLFVSAAQAVEPTFVLDDANVATVAAICARLDGLPLALELAAARIRLLSPPALLAQLDGKGETPVPWRVLAGGRRDALPHHRSLWETIEWSYALLTEAEQALFRRLAVFSGGATLEAVNAVCVLPTDDVEVEVVEGLASLLDKSLLRRQDVGGTARVGMLETIREYGRTRLYDAGEEAAIAEAHARYFAVLAASTAPHLTGAQQVAWLDRLEAEHNNLRAALQWALDHGQAEIGMELGAGLWHFWYIRSHHHEGVAWLNALLELPGDDAHRAQVLHGLAMLARRTDDYALAERSAELGLALCRALADEEGIASNLRVLGFLHYRSGDHANAQALLEECLAIFRRLGNQEGVAAALTNLSYFVKDAAQARTYAEESLAMRRATGNLHGVSVTLGNLGYTALIDGDYPTAVRYLEENLELCRSIGNRDGEINSLNGLAIASYGRQEYDAALAYGEAAVALVNTGNKSSTIETNLRLGAVYLLRGNIRAAAAMLQKSYRQGLSIHTAAGEYMIYLAGLANAVGQPAATLRFVGRASRYEGIMTADAASCTRFTAAARGMLAPAIAEAAWAAGQAMREEEILALAETVIDAALAPN